MFGSSYPTCITHKQIHTYIYVYIHTYIRTYVHTYIHTYTYTHTHTHIPKNVALVREAMYTLSCVCNYKYIYVYPCTHIYCIHDGIASTAGHHCQIMEFYISARYIYIYICVCVCIHVHIQVCIGVDKMILNVDISGLPQTCLQAYIRLQAYI